MLDRLAAIFSAGNIWGIGWRISPPIFWPAWIAGLAPVGTALHARGLVPLPPPSPHAKTQSSTVVMAGSKPSSNSSHPFLSLSFPYIIHSLICPRLPIGWLASSSSTQISPQRSPFLPHFLLIFFIDSSQKPTNQPRSQQKWRQLTNPFSPFSFPFDLIGLIIQIQFYPFPPFSFTQNHCSLFTVPNCPLLAPHIVKAKKAKFWVSGRRQRHKI